MARDLLQKWLDVQADPEWKTIADSKCRHNMRGYDKEAEGDYGQLMACLMREQDRFATGSDFHAFALESVRRFIVDLRSLDIELTMRPRYLNDSPSHPAKVGGEVE
jgi:hypothetical protein